MSGAKTGDVLLAILALGIASALFAYEPRENLNQNQSVSDGTITFSYAPEFGLAVTPEQLLVRSYIPPCDENFDYCLYLVSGEYQGTNFESAGLRIKERNDLGSREACLNTPPEGYTTFKPEIHVGQEHATSAFSPVRGGAAGHYADGALYRLSYDSRCYEFETRIGESQFANYPLGAIKEFTAQDRADVMAQLLEVLNNISLPDGRKNLFVPSGSILVS